MSIILDIDTAAVAAPQTIVDMKGLSDVIFEMAALQLVVDQAAKEQQLEIEKSKKVFEEVTRPQMERLASLLAGVEAYAKANRDKLFPGKKKTLKVLIHELKFRASSSIEGNEAHALRMIDILLSVATERQLTVEQVGILKGLKRQPAVELNKDAVKAAWPENEALIRELGFKMSTSEAFKVVFNFSPTQAS